MARLRAERRCGQLLKEMDKAKGTLKQGRKLLSSKFARAEDKPKTLAEMGLTYDQSSTYQKLADLPEEKMEDLAKHSGDYRPSARNIVPKPNCLAIFTKIIHSNIALAKSSAGIHKPNAKSAPRRLFKVSFFTPISLWWADLGGPSCPPLLFARYCDLWIACHPLTSQLKVAVL